MSEKVSKALLDLLNEISETETIMSKVQAAIFVKKCENFMKEKVSYLYNLLQVEASSYGQNPEKQFDKVGNIIDKYRKKLKIIYKEFYLQYVNAQKEIGDARINQKVAMVNYQKVINEGEKSGKSYTNLKSKLKVKNEAYEEIIKKCEYQFAVCIAEFQEKIDNCFFIESNLEVANENNFFAKIKNLILNLFSGASRYKESLSRYEAKVDNINTEEIVRNLREKTIDFVTDILEIKDEKLEEAV